MTDNFDQFKFDPASLSAARPPGISAFLRIKNGAEFVRLAVESHIDFYDEIIAVYNDCTDATPQILHDLATKYPQKIKVFHYLPKVVATRTKEHAQTAAESVHSSANYSNYALSKTTYNTATKLDDDHLAIPQKLAPLIDAVRKDIAIGKKKIYTFSGINLMRDHNSNIRVRGHIPFSGTGDIAYFPVSEGTIFRQTKRTQKLYYEDKTMEKKYMGIVYFHLKALKKKFRSSPWSKLNPISFDELSTESVNKRLRKQINPCQRMLYKMHQFGVMCRLKYKLPPPPPRFHQLRLTRLARLADDLREINFERDALRWLEKK